MPNRGAGEFLPGLLCRKRGRRARFRAMKLKELKKGDFFKLKPNGRVYVRDSYNRSTKKYDYYDFDDVNRWHDAKGDKEVIVDFNF